MRLIEMRMRFFIWLRQNRSTINGILITILTSLVFNTISDTQGYIFKDFDRIIKQIFEFETLSGFISILTIIVLLTYNIVFVLIQHSLNKKAFFNEFVVLMKKYTGHNLVDNVENGCLSWGEGKTVEICSDIILGWNPGNVLIESYDNNRYIFFSEEESEKKFGKKSYYFNEKDYTDFKNSESFMDIIRKGNNLPRFMLKECSKNFDKKNRKLLLSIGRTEWSQTSYVWDKFGKSEGNEIDSNILMREYSADIKSGNEAAPFLPNSLCMHLIIESLDSKVVLALISESKRNDNPGTWAATLGEQIELDDFTDGNNYYDEFIVNWMRRAFQEEFKLNDHLYQDIVDESSLKCLSIDFESDRYNFALLCTVRLRYSFDVFSEKVKVLLSTEEASKLKAIQLSEIPEILFAYGDENERKKYHPSTYLRLLVFLVHKYGYSKTERLLLNK